MPSLFIGSSSEALSYAEDVSQVLRELSRDVKAVLWNDDGVFRLGDTIIENIEQIAQRHHGAILIATPDDKTTKRGSTVLNARDNVVFEAGYFTAAYGRASTLLLKVGAVELPKDLDGVVVAAVDAPCAARSKDYDHAQFRRDLKDELRKWLRVLDPGAGQHRIERKLDRAIASVEVGPDERAYADRLLQLLDKKLAPSDITLLYADIDDLRTITRTIFSTERTCPGPLGRRLESAIRDDFIRTLRIAIADAIYNAHPDGKHGKHDMFALPDPDVVVVARKLPYPAACEIARTAQELFREDVGRLWKDVSVTIMVSDLAQLQPELEKGPAAVHSFLRSRLAELKDDDERGGRGRVYGHEHLRSSSSTG